MINEEQAAARRGDFRMSTEKRLADPVFLGVDFGTTNSAMAVCRGANVDMIYNDIGDNSSPSCVHVAVDDTTGRFVIDVGESAAYRPASDTGCTIRNIKCILGRPMDANATADTSAAPFRPLGSVTLEPTLDGRSKIFVAPQVEFAPEEIASMLLSDLKKTAEERLAPASIKQTVIAVPCYFDAPRRHAVQDAVVLAGFENFSLVNETSAIAVVCADKLPGKRTGVILDVGGGGGSVCVFQTKVGEVHVLAASARRLPGGEDIDHTMVEYLKAEIQREHNWTVRDARAVKLLRSHWEQAKVKLMSEPMTKIATFLPSGDNDSDGLNLNRTVERAELNRKCEAHFQRIVQELLWTLALAGVSADQLEDVILVGRSARIPRLRNLVDESILRGRPFCTLDMPPNEAVARGAALLAAGRVTLFDVTPFNLTVLFNGNKIGGVVRNGRIPMKCTQISGPGEIKIFQGSVQEDISLHQNRDESALNMASPIFVRRLQKGSAGTFVLNENGIIVFQRSENDVVRVPLRGCLLSNALDELRDRAERRAKADREARLRVDAKNALEEKCRFLLQELAAAGGDLPDFHPCAEFNILLRETCERNLGDPNDDPEIITARVAEVCTLEAELRRCRSEEVKAKEAREELTRMCESVLASELELDTQPDISLVRELRVQCKAHLHWISLRPFAHMESVQERIDSVQAERKFLADCRNRWTATDKLKTELKNMCNELLALTASKEGIPKGHATDKSRSDLRKACHAHLAYLARCGCDVESVDIKKKLAELRTLQVKNEQQLMLLEETKQTKDELQTECNTLQELLRRDYPRGHPCEGIYQSLRNEHRASCRLLYLVGNSYSNNISAMDFKPRLYELRALKADLDRCYTMWTEAREVREELASVCLSVKETEILMDSHPDASLVRELRAQCDTYLQFLEDTPVGDKYDLLNKVDIVRAMWSDLLASPERLEATKVAKNDVESKCNTLLRWLGNRGLDDNDEQTDKFRKILRSQCEQCLQWLSTDPPVDKKDVLERLSILIDSWNMAQGEVILEQKRQQIAEARCRLLEKCTERLQDLNTGDCVKVPEPTRATWRREIMTYQAWLRNEPNASLEQCDAKLDDLRDYWLQVVTPVVRRYRNVQSYRRTPDSRRGRGGAMGSPSSSGPSSAPSSSAPPTPRAVADTVALTRRRGGGTQTLLSRAWNRITRRFSNLRTRPQ